MIFKQCVQEVIIIVEYCKLHGHFFRFKIAGNNNGMCFQYIPTLHEIIDALNTMYKLKTNFSVRF